MHAFIMPTRLLRSQIAPLVLLVAIAACTPKPFVTAHPSAPDGQNPPPLVSQTGEAQLSSLPDLIIKFMSLDMDGNQGNCVKAYSRYGIRVRIENVGSAGAGPFVVDLNDQRQTVDSGLTAGENIALFFVGTVASGNYEAAVDPTDQVVESREDNNTLSYLAPTPTPPLLCTPAPTGTP